MLITEERVDGHEVGFRRILVRALAPLAPLHNPANALGIELARRLYPDVEEVAVFDTAFQATLPARAARYALPRELADRHGIRRYGFHGTSHACVARRAAEHWTVRSVSST